jgi:probable HAF family extracellular repeat protein
MRLPALLTRWRSCRAVSHLTVVGLLGLGCIDAGPTAPAAPLPGLDPTLPIVAADAEPPGPGRTLPGTPQSRAAAPGVARAARVTVLPPIDLGTLGGCCSMGVDINDAGQVAGQSTTSTGEWRAFLWTPTGGICATSARSAGARATRSASTTPGRWSGGA